MIDTSITTTKTNKRADFRLEDIEKAYEELFSVGNLKILVTIKVTPSYSIQLKKELPSTDINPLFGIPVIVDPTLKKPFEFVYKK